jgi:hypothetical protein
MHAALLDPISHFEPTDDHDAVIGPPLVREQLEDLLGNPRRNGLGEPERALMRALLLDAVLCLIGQSAPATERPRLAAEACSWFTSRSREWIFSFENVCEALGFDAEYLRRRLFALSAGAASVSASDAAAGRLSQARTALAVRSIRKSSQRRRRALHFFGRAADTA